MNERNADLLWEAIEKVKRVMEDLCAELDLDPLEEIDELF